MMGKKTAEEALTEGGPVRIEFDKDDSLTLSTVPGFRNSMYRKIGRMYGVATKWERKAEYLEDGAGWIAWIALITSALFAVVGGIGCLVISPNPHGSKTLVTHTSFMAVLIVLCFGAAVLIATIIMMVTFSVYKKALTRDTRAARETLTKIITAATKLQPKNSDKFNEELIALLYGHDAENVPLTEPGKGAVRSLYNFKLVDNEKEHYLMITNIKDQLSAKSTVRTYAKGLITIEVG
jgi:hypothetical protein